MKCASLFTLVIVFKDNIKNKTKNYNNKAMYMYIVTLFVISMRLNFKLMISFYE